jgi:hypothetical protein
VCALAGGQQGHRVTFLKKKAKENGWQTDTKSCLWSVVTCFTKSSETDEKCPLKEWAF